MSHQPSMQVVEGLQPFPSQSSPIANGQYSIKCTNEQEVESWDEKVQAKVWFQSPPLDLATLRRINRLQLFAESHDQGFADQDSAGNWTWLELVILNDESATSPRVKEGVELVWMSHPNRFRTTEYGWCAGHVFDEHHDLLRLLEEGNVIAVRICSRFAAWKIAARTGYLVIDIGRKEVEREPLEFGQIVSEIKNIQETFKEVNLQMHSAFLPSLPDSLFRADVVSTGGERALRVLSLDGGGVRGLSALHLLKAVMDKSSPNKKPCEVFDMIGGTSTGGLIAMMLGRLQMTIDECIQKYKEFMRDVFKQGFFGKNARLATQGEFYDASELESVVKKLIREKLGRDDVKLLDENGPCKIFVMAVRRDAANNRGPVFLRSYTNPLDKSLLPDIQLWEAARATSAAPAYFAPIKVGDYELVDGGLGANNPLGWLWTEVLGVFGPARPTNCFLSIGTGIPANRPLPKPGVLGSHEVEESFAAIATNSQIIHVLFRTLVDAFAPQPKAKKYWRLTVGEEIPEWDEEKTSWLFRKTKEKHLDNYKDVGDLDDIGALEGLMQMTNNYIVAQDGQIGDCANALKADL